MAAKTKIRSKSASRPLQGSIVASILSRIDFCRPPVPKQAPRGRNLRKTFSNLEPPLASASSSSGPPQWGQSEDRAALPMHWRCDAIRSPVFSIPESPLRRRRRAMLRPHISGDAEGVQGPRCPATWNLVLHLKSTVVLWPTQAICF